MFSVGDWVEVLSPDQVLATLDGNGALEQLPFMPEMLFACRRRYRVMMRAERTCARGLGPGERPIRRLDHTIVLDGQRCNGEWHGGCQLGCMLFWKEAWLKRVPGPAAEEGSVGAARTVSLRIHQPSDPSAFYCQGTQLARATKAGDPPWNPMQYVRMVRVRTLTLPQLVGMGARIVGRKVARSVHPPRPRTGPARDEVLGLQPGEWVRVRSKAEIQNTLDAKGTLRGLSFMGHYDVYCGKTMRVRERVERILVEETGQIRTIHNTVLLEGAVCPRHQGCARGMPPLWREAWLERVAEPRRPRTVPDDLADPAANTSTGA